jgi:CheY-like chemotaxis protein
MPEGGRLVIRTDASADRSRVRLTVRDTGCGMDEHTRLHAFEPFFTTKDPAHGTGLGLSMVFGIVTQSGGTVEVESELGEGATFVVELPAVASAEAGAEGSDERPRATTTGETVLLVEDEEIVRALGERVLENAGYTVLVAANGAEAIALAERQETGIDLLLTDVVMPGMSGPQVAKRLTALRPGLRVLYTSGYAEDDVWTNGGNGDGFIAKPFTPELLRRKVAEMLEHASR